MSPLPEPQASVNAKAPVQQIEEFRFIYKNKEYDCSEYVSKHPGGKSFFDKMKDEKKDFTEYFRALHSKKALKILKSQQIVKTNLEESACSKQYTAIKKKVKHLFEPDFLIEFLLIVGLSIGLYIGVTADWPIAIPTIALTQIIGGWVGHSTNHNRHPLIYRMSTPVGILHGFATKWWQFKHNNHHIFTNRIGKDDDINHEYQYWQYCFLYLKWKYDSLITVYNQPDIIYLIIHWIICLQQKIWIMVVAQLIAGFFSACILIGNHEREYKFFKRIDKPFIEHQIITSRNYDWTDWLSNLLMGGMQFQTEHHLFPQIPFYRLPHAAKIINRELNKLGYQINVGPIL